MFKSPRKIQKAKFKKMGYPRPYHFEKQYFMGQEIDFPVDLPWPNVFPKGTMAAMIEGGIVKNG